MELRDKIEKYMTFNEQEEKDKELMLKYIDTFDNVLTRENEFGHFTASSWVVKIELKYLSYIIIYINHGHGLADMQMDVRIY